MSEFKYACPVCGQHIKCDSSQAGTVMDCPTCFQKIVVPQAPTSEDQKFILTGTRLEDKKTSSLADAEARRTLEPAKAFPAAVAFLLFLALCVGASLYFFRGKLHVGPGWQQADVGAVGAPGTFSQKNGILSVGGSGADIWFQADAFHFVYRPTDGDVSLTARVQSIQNTDPWAKAGVMVRASDAPDAMFAAILVTPGSGVAFQQRTAPGSQATSVQIVSGPRTPLWVRLARRGNTFTADYSKDGSNWKTAGSTSMAMAGKAWAGLAVCSHNHAMMCEAAFDQVAVQMAGAPKEPATANTNSVVHAPPPPKPVAPPANDTNWMLDLQTNAIPDAPVAGRIHGQDFLMERASFQNGALTIRVGNRGPAESGAVINFSGADAEELSGKTINVLTNAEKAARVSLRWKDDTGEVQKTNYDAGYALRLEFGALANNRLPGKIYLCLPDPEKSYLLGSFRANVSKPKPKANPPPKQ
jgi:regulation of enolase protein 1 (concanavalin A-like superfamily)/DNA-directed RNA polymerase subunit RPC12/RpoP